MSERERKVYLRWVQEVFHEVYRKQFYEIKYIERKKNVDIERILNRVGGWGWGVSDEWIKRSTICQKLFVGGAERRRGRGSFKVK